MLRNKNGHTFNEILFVLFFVLVSILYTNLFMVNVELNWLHVKKIGLNFNH